MDVKVYKQLSKLCTELGLTIEHSKWPNRSWTVEDTVAGAEYKFCEHTLHTVPVGVIMNMIRDWQEKCYPHDDSTPKPYYTQS